MRTLVLPVVLGVAMLLTGCDSDSAGNRPGAAALSPTTASPGTASPGTASSTTGSPAPGTPLPVQVAQVAHVGRYYSVVLHNPNRDVGLVRQGFALIAHHADGRSAAFGAERPPETPDTCCLIEWLPPGGDYGLFFDDGDAPRDLSGFALVLRGGGWRRWAGLARPALRTTATGPLRMGPGNRGLGTTSVHVRVRSSSPTAVDAVVQPLLVDRTGRLVAVIGARVSCVRPGRGLPVVLDYPAAVPAGTTVGRIITWSTTERGSASRHC